MYESSYVPPPLIEEKPKAPILGILSCVAAILAVLFFCGIFILIMVIGSSNGFDAEALTTESMNSLGFGILGLTCASGVSSLVGIALGILSLLIRETVKVWGIAGLVLNGMIILVFCLFFAIGVLAV